MEIEQTLIEAEAYYGDPTRDRYYVKITFVGTGMFINSFVVQPSKYEDQPYWVQPPKHKQGFNKWVNTVDFDKSCELWQIIEYKAREAVDIYKNDSSNKTPKLDKIVEVNIDEPITLDDIPFGDDPTGSPQATQTKPP